MDISFATFVPWAVFGGFALAAWALMNYLTARSSRADERLEELRNPLARAKEREDAKQQSMLEKAAPALSKALAPKSEFEQSKLKVSLANAGFNSPHAVELYLALKFASLIGGLILGSGYGLASWGVTQKGIFAAIVGGGLGFYLPEIVLYILKKSRQEKIFLSLPDSLDLLVVCVEAGLGLDAGLRRVSEELSDTAPELCGEFALCNFQLQMGRPRREVLHDLGVRSGVDDLKALAAILIQADRFGSSIAQALRVQSDTMRVKRSQLAEERAQKTAVKLIFPLVLFIFPGIFVVLVGPAAISMINNLLKVNG
ncbi:MAG: type II secretion system F family protein [Planctomycetaceae bacterium]